MPKLSMYQVDAFASEVFKGNAAAVCPLDAWLDDRLMQAIALENNLSETAFFVPSQKGRRERFHLRWFTPTREVDLCGHATLATAHVVLNILEPGRKSVTFDSQSGPLVVSRDDAAQGLTMTFPSRPPVPCPADDALSAALGKAPRELWKARDPVAVYDTPEDVLALAPDMSALSKLEHHGVIVTAPGDFHHHPSSKRPQADFVSRFFAPNVGIPEDPVTGSAHCTLIPFWSKRLGKTTLRAHQCSARGGDLACEDRGDTVLIGGRAVLYLEGTISV